MKRNLLKVSSWLLCAYVLAVVVYARYEHHSFSDALWWAFMTFTTVGYGDQYPTTLAGRTAGIMLVFTAVFVVVPTITAVVSSHLIVDDDAFTHEEQEEIKMLLRDLHRVTVAERK